MTVLNATPKRPARRPYLRASALGLALGLVAAFGAVDAANAGAIASAHALMAQSAATAPMPSLDPAKQAPGAIQASGSRECGREADRAGHRVRLHHRQAVRAGGGEIARDQSEVGAHEARAGVSRLSSK